MHLLYIIIFLLTTSVFSTMADLSFRNYNFSLESLNRHVIYALYNGSLSVNKWNKITFHNFLVCIRNFWIDNPPDLQYGIPFCKITVIFFLNPWKIHLTLKFIPRLDVFLNHMLKKRHKYILLDKKIMSLIFKLLHSIIFNYRVLLTVRFSNAWITHYLCQVLLT